MLTARLLIAALAIATLVGIALTCLQALLAGRLLGRPSGEGGVKNSPFGFGPRGRADGQEDSQPVDSIAPREDRPRVSILKPLSGLEDRLTENLQSFARLPGPRYEVILSVAKADDAAVRVARDVMEQNPGAPFSLVIGGLPEGRAKNPKVERLMAAARHARGEILFISDANVRVSPDALQKTLESFRDPAVGCVSNVFVGSGARSFGAVVESLHLLTFVLPGAALAAWGDVPCVVGKSMAIRADVLAEIGGFAALADVLAEDQQIGLRVKAAGYRVVLSPVLVHNVTIKRTLGRALDRQIRWGKIRFSFSRALYTSEWLLNPMPLAFGALAVSAATAAEWAPLTAALLFVALAARQLQATILNRVTGSQLSQRQLWAMPLKDILQFLAQIVPYLSREVSWHGHRARLGKGTVMLPAKSVLRAA